MWQFFSSENITFVSLALLAIGFAKFILYYKAFNVPIIDYIEPGEIITLFADNVVTASLVVLLLAYPYATIILPFNSLHRGVNLSVLERLERYSSLLGSSVFLSLLALIILIAVVWKRTKIHKSELFRFVFAWPVVVILIPVLALEIGLRTEQQVMQSSIIVAALTLSFSFLIMLATYNEIRKVKALGYFKGVVVRFASSEITSTSEDFFIGKTKSFVFFYSTTNKASTAYSTADLKSISYPFE